MQHRYRRGVFATLAFALLATFLTPVAAGAQSERAPLRYEVTIENLTGAQPLTPPVLVGHNGDADVFETGTAASAPLANLAENGDVSGLVAALEGAAGVRSIDVAATTAGPLVGGESVTLEIDVPRDARYLSFASMLICSNDGFVGGDSLTLSRRRGVPTEYLLNSYDAGSETNTEDFDDLVPPCGPLSGVDSGGAGTGASNAALAEGGVVTRHAGIIGTADLTTAVHGWDDPAVKLTVMRVYGATKYQVEVTNLTDGQPFTPPVVAAQRRSVDVFSSGHEASAGIQDLAENGGVPSIVEELAGTRGVGNIAVGDGPLLPGETQTLTLYGTPGKNRFFFGSMLICTNDGFAARDNTRLPREVGGSRTVSVRAYDAGTEINTEAFDDMVPPCGPLTGVDSAGAGTGASNPALAENGVVTRHGGIDGSGDLSVDIHDWEEPTASITVTRIG